MNSFLEPPKVLVDLVDLVVRSSFAARLSQFLPNLLRHLREVRLVEHPVQCSRHGCTVGGHGRQLLAVGRHRALDLQAHPRHLLSARIPWEVIGSRSHHQGDHLPTCLPAYPPTNQPTTLTMLATKESMLATEVVKDFLRFDAQQLPAWHWRSDQQSLGRPPQAFQPSGTP